jgi:peptidoglycan/xylan/chitin deacetylase (PgdA/CDA1 family)
VFGRTIRETAIADGVALTFDDGPNPAITPALLDLLDRYEAKATFFVIGSRVRAFPHLAREIVKRGHTIGNHTETHPRLTLCTPRRTRAEIDRCDEAIGEATGACVRWMRPPYGYRSPWLDGIVRKRREEVVMWNVAARDWATHDTQKIIQRLRGTRCGDIVLLHDGNHRVLQGERKHVLGALEHWLPRWKDSGIRFLSMDQVKASGEANGIP